MYEREIKIIQADMREYSALGHSINTYREEYVTVALIAEDIDPSTVDAHPAFLITAALLDTCLKALKQ